MTWPLKATTELTYDDYTVAWICALPIEKTAARNMLDELHITPPQPEHDKNIYTFGRICGHNVVIVCQGDMGTTVASMVATRMDSSFRKLRFGLLVGIAGGIPGEKDIRLGDVVISKGDGRSGGVVAHDRGKVTLTGFEPRSFLNGVPEVLRNAFRELESRLMDQDSQVTVYLSEAAARNPHFSAFERPASVTDNLFQSDYSHVNPEDKACIECKKEYIVDRPPRNNLLVHFGVVASGDQVIKNATERAKILAAHPGVLAVEMEAAGLMDIFGCATIRGICDYADSHKNDGWHKYASASAAAVAKEVLRIIPVSRATTTLSTAVADIPRSHWLVPFPRNERFVGRDSLLNQLATKLSSSHLGQRVAITGLGGVGKTQIVLEYAYRTKETSPGCSVFWVPASSNASFEKGYSDIAECLKITGITKENANVKQLVKAALSQESTGPWILIIDNADDVDVLFKKGDDLESLPLIDYLPASCKGSIIFTTRTRKAAVKQAGSDIIQVDEMSQDDAMEFLRKSLLRTDRLTENGPAIKLFELLAYLPLALSQAVSFINMNDIPISEYIGLYEGSEEDIIEILSEDFEDQRRYREVKNPVAATWLISFRQICQQDELAGDYLSFMACLVRQNIPQSILPIPPSKKKAIDAIGTLTAYSFITKHDLDNLFDVHRLVHIATRNWLRNESKLTVWTDKALVRLADIFPSGDHENRATWSAYLPHACNVLAQDHVEVMSGTKWIELLDNVGWCLNNTGQYREAEKIHRQALDLCSEVLGPEHPHTLRSMCYVAAALSKQGNYQEAEKMHRQELDLCSKVLGPEHLDTIASMGHVAGTLGDQGNYQESEQMHRRVLDLSLKLLGPEHPDTIASMGHVAGTLRAQGNYQEAEQIRRQVLKLQIKVLGPEHPHTLMSMGGVATALRDQGSYQEAEQMHRQALEFNRKVLGPEHPHTLTSMSLVATTLSSQGKYREAQQIHQQVLELRTKVLGPEHPRTLTSMSHVATALSDRGSYKEAEKMRRQVLELHIKVLGPEHPNTLASMGHVATALSDQGNYREAEQMHRQTLELYIKVLGPEHPHTLTNMSHLAGTLSDQGKYQEAERMHRQELDLCSKVLGPEHPDTVTSMSCVATALSEQGNHQEAGRIYRQVLELYKKMLGPEHPHTLTSMSNIATALSKQGEYQEAERIYRQVLELYVKVLGPEHPHTLIGMSHVATALSNQGKYTAAGERHREVLALREKVLGKEHPKTLESANNLVQALKNQKNYPEVEKTHQKTLVLTTEVPGEEALPNDNKQKRSWTGGEIPKSPKRQKIT